MLPSLSFPSWRMLRLGIGGMVVGGVLGLVNPVAPVTARGPCKCVMPELGSYKCEAPTSQACSDGGWSCEVTCKD